MRASVPFIIPEVCIIPELLRKPFEEQVRAIVKIHKTAALPFYLTFKKYKSNIIVSRLTIS